MGNTLYVMVGIPGSGKSYKAKQLQLQEEAEYVSRDEVRFSIIREGEEYFSKEKQVFREFVRRIQSALDGNKSVIADATHINKASRSKLLNALDIDSLMDTEIVAVYCDTTFEECLERNRKREGISRVPDDAMHSMNKWSSRPRLDEGFSKIIKLSEEE